MGRAPASHRAPGWCPSCMGSPQITFGWAASCWSPRSSSHGAPAPAITARGQPWDGPSTQIRGFICLFASCSWIPLWQKAAADAQPRAGGGGIVAGPNPGLSSAKTSPLPHEATTEASPNAPGPKKIPTKQPGLILPQAHFQPRVGAGSTPRAGLTPSISSPVPQEIYHLRRAPSPRRGAQLLARISSHLIPPRERGGDLRGSLAKPRLASGLPFPAEARPRWVKQMWQQMRNSSAPRGQGGKSSQKKSRAGWGEGKPDFWRGGRQEAAEPWRRQSRCEPGSGCAGSSPAPWGLFPKQQQQIGCRFQAGWGNKKRIKPKSFDCGD